MRRWGFGLAGLLAFALFVGATNPSEEPAPLASETTVSEATPSTESEDSAQSQDQLESESPAIEAEPEQSEATAEPSQESAAVTQEANTEEPTATPTPVASPSPTQTPSPTQPAAAPEATPSGLEALLARLVIEPEFVGGYDRSLFPHWIDADRNGCDTRREVLIIEAVVAPVVGASCSLSGGSWYSAFDGVTTDDPSVFDIDHMVPLKEAWDSGAHAWDRDRRRAFANDLDLPEALIAVSRSSNRSKSDRDPADWLPPLRSYHCQYVRDWMVVKIKWELSVDSREFSALRSVAAGC